MGSIRARQDNGLLFFDFRFRGQRCREQTLLADTPANRKRLDKALAAIEGDIKAGTFDYAKTFPGSRVHGRPIATASALLSAAAPPVGQPAAADAAPSASPTPTFRDFTTTWLAEHQVEWRRSHIKVLKSTIDGHLLPAFGDRPVGAITKADILTFRAKLSTLPGRTGDKLSNKRINGVLERMALTLAATHDRAW